MNQRRFDFNLCNTDLIESTRPGILDLDLPDVTDVTISSEPKLESQPPKVCTPKPRRSGNLEDLEDWVEQNCGGGSFDRWAEYYIYTEPTRRDQFAIADAFTAATQARLKSLITNGDKLASNGNEGSNKDKTKADDEAKGSIYLAIGTPQARERRRRSRNLSVGSNPTSDGRCPSATVPGLESMLEGGKRNRSSTESSSPGTAKKKSKNMADTNQRIDESVRVARDTLMARGFPKTKTPEGRAEMEEFLTMIAALTVKTEGMVEVLGDKLDGTKEDVQKIATEVGSVQATVSQLQADVKRLDEGGGTWAKETFEEQEKKIDDFIRAHNDRMDKLEAQQKAIADVTKADVQKIATEVGNVRDAVTQAGNGPTLIPRGNPNATLTRKEVEVVAKFRRSFKIIGIETNENETDSDLADAVRAWLARYAGFKTEILNQLEMQKIERHKVVNQLGNDPVNDPLIQSEAVTITLTEECAQKGMMGKVYASTRRVRRANEVSIRAQGRKLAIVDTYPRVLDPLTDRLFAEMRAIQAKKHNGKPNFQATVRWVPDTQYVTVFVRTSPVKDEQSALTGATFPRWIKRDRAIAEMEKVDPGFSGQVLPPESLQPDRQSLA